jgi:DNA-directed RNA polymerase specialized sigma24 family protein
MDTISLHGLQHRGSTPVRMTERPFDQAAQLRDVEAAVCRRILQGETRSAAALAMTAYGAEIFGFLIGVLDGTSEAKTVYADVAQRVATEIEGFESRVKLRIWLYALSRRELRDRRLRRRPADLVDESESETAEVSHARSSPRRTRALSKLRRSMTQEERELLILRVDRRLDWRELAQTALGEGTSIGELAEEIHRTKSRIGAILARLESEAVQERLLRPRGP